MFSYRNPDNNKKQSGYFTVIALFPDHAFTFYLQLGYSFIINNFQIKRNNILSDKYLKKIPVIKSKSGM